MWRRFSPRAFDKHAHARTVVAWKDLGCSKTTQVAQVMRAHVYISFPSGQSLMEKDEVENSKQREMLRAALREMNVQ